MYFDNLTLLGLVATAVVVGLVLNLILRDDCPRGNCHEG